jgi:hypothetical protein
VTVVALMSVIFIVIATEVRFNANMNSSWPRRSQMFVAG